MIAIVRVVHVVTAVLMGWPFYALVAVNNRARLGPPLGDRVDLYLEAVIKNRTIPCFIFQGTALASGLALIFLRGSGVAVLVSNVALGVKFLLLLAIASALAYVHLRLQPAIDGVFATAGGSVLTREAASRVQVLRLRRKRLATFCLFAVLVMVMLGVQVWTPFPPWLTLALIVAIALFTWRAYSSVIPYGWA